MADNEDVDYYVVEAKKGERITAEVEGIRLGLTLFDPYVAILDAKRFELASSDDAAPDLAGRLRLGRRPRGRHVHRPGPRERLRGQRGLPLPPARRQLPPADGHGPGRRQAGRDGRRPLDRRRAGRDDDERDPARRPRPRLRPGRPGRARGPPPIRTSSGSARSATPSRPSRTTTRRTATPFDPADGPQRRDRRRRATSTTTSSRRRRARPTTSGSSPADPLAARLGPHDRHEGGRQRRRGQRRQRRARQLHPLQRPRGRRVRRLAARPPREGRARLRLPDRGQPGRAEADPEHRRTRRPREGPGRWPSPCPGGTARRS